MCPLLIYSARGQFTQTRPYLHLLHTLASPLPLKLHLGRLSTLSTLWSVRCFFLGSVSVSLHDNILTTKLTALINLIYSSDTKLKDRQLLNIYWSFLCKCTKSLWQIQTFYKDNYQHCLALTHCFLSSSVILTTDRVINIICLFDLNPEFEYVKFLQLNFLLLLQSWLLPSLSEAQTGSKKDKCIASESISERLRKPCWHLKRYRHRNDYAVVYAFAWITCFTRG